jgi:hypothetical protein
MYRRLSVALAFLFSIPAFAQPDMRDCVDDVPSLLRVVKKKEYSGVITASMVKQFVGVWKKRSPVIFHGNVEFTISKSTKLVLEGTELKICPQTDGTFYLYNVGNPSEYATLTFRNSQTLQMSEGHGRLSWLEDSYAKLPK